MQHDEMIWQVINNQFCSYKTTLTSAKSDHRDFCRHEYSVTGLCNKSSCPLANSRYATIREIDGRICLFLKTIERAHSPKNLWEKVYLSRNYAKALTQLDEHLAYFPKALVHRNKQRLTKITQYLIRMRKIKLRELAGRKAKHVIINRKIEQRDERREKKALIAGKIETNIEKELLQRLAKGTYGDLYNFPEVPYQKALEGVESEEEEESAEEESDSEEEELGAVEYVEDLEDDSEDEMELEDMEMLSYADSSDSDDEEESNGSDTPSEASESDNDSESLDTLGKKRKASVKSDKSPKKRRQQRKPRTRVEIEYEDEEDDAPMVQEQVIAGAAW